MSRDPLVILSARRTPVGAFQGVFAGVTAPQLGSVAIKAALADSGVAPGDVDEVIMGCVLAAGLGQAPARQAALGAGIPASVPSTTINKMCGSAMRAIMLAGDQILAGSARIMVAGGLESMTNAPYLLPKARAGYRMGHQEVLDHMFTDGLQSPWDGQLMGCFAEATSSKYDFSRQAQDDFARESLTPRPGGDRERRLRGRDRAGHRQDPQGRSGDRQGRDAGHHRRVEDSHAEARVPQGRVGHGREFGEHFRRRRGRGVDP